MGWVVSIGLAVADYCSCPECSAQCMETEIVKSTTSDTATVARTANYNSATATRVVRCPLLVQYSTERALPVRQLLVALW